MSTTDSSDPPPAYPSIVSPAPSQLQTGGMSRLRAFRAAARLGVPLEHCGPVADSSPIPPDEARHSSNSTPISTPKAPRELESHPASHTRPDLFARTTAQQLISSVLLSPSSSPAEKTDLLADCREGCVAQGVPFGELLAREIDEEGMAPLEWALMHFSGGEVVDFLLEHTPARDAERTVRSACLKQGDNALFQALRARLAARDTHSSQLSYDLSLNQYTKDKRFEVRVVIPPYPPLSEKRPSRPPCIEWIALSRLWALYLPLPASSESQWELHLLQGEPAQIEHGELVLRSPDASRLAGPLVLQLEPGRAVPLAEAGRHALGFRAAEGRGWGRMESGMELELMVELAEQEENEQSEGGGEWEELGVEKQWVMASWAWLDGEAGV